MSKSASMSTDTIQVKGKKQKSQILQAMVEALYRFNPRALLGSPILFTLWLAAMMATLESLLGQPLSGVAPSLAWQLTAGSGSPSGLPTSPRPWPRGAARRGPTVWRPA